MRKIKAIMHIGKFLDSSFKKEAFAHYTKFSPVRKIKAVMPIGKCLNSLFKKKAFAHYTNFSPVRKIKVVMYIGKCLDSLFKKKAFAYNKVIYGYMTKVTFKTKLKNCCMSYTIKSPMELNYMLFLTRKYLCYLDKYPGCVA